MKSKAVLSAEEGAQKLFDLVHGRSDPARSVKAGPEKKKATGPGRPIPVIGVTSPEDLQEIAASSMKRKEEIERAKEVRTRKAPRTKNRIVKVCECPCKRTFEVEPYRAETARFYSKACMKGMTRKASNLKWIFTPEMDAKIAEAYAGKVGMSKGVVVRVLAKELDVPSYSLISRARTLELINVVRHGLNGRPSPWSEEEKSLLHKNIKLSLGHIGKMFSDAGFSRSRTAIMMQIKRTYGPKPKENFSASQVAKLFGIDLHTVLSGYGWAG